MAQAEGDASRTLHEQAVIHASAQDALTREATYHNAPDPQTARENLMAQPWPAGEILPYLKLIDDPDGKIEGESAWLSERQARAILDLRLQRLTGMEREKVEQEGQEIQLRITEYLEILASRPRRMQVLSDELIDIRDRFADPRRTIILENEFEHDIEDLIQREDMVMTVTQASNGSLT